MIPLTLAQAAARIKAACVREEHASDAFFFFVGAGLAAPTVKLARDIELECKADAEAEGNVKPPATDTAMDRYSHWFQAAHFEPVDRQRYLRDLIKDKQISPASFRLAHLLLGDNTPRLVVTPNFDDFLTRALMLFGKQHVVCDHPATAQRIDPESRDIQILHVHGSYWFYDCVNLSGEIDSRAESSPFALSVASRLDQVLMKRAPIVIGYSGWEKDVFMTSLKRRFNAGPLAHNLYWFCYRAEDVAALPEWLTSRQDVAVIAPEPVEDGSDRRSQTRPTAQTANPVVSSAGAVDPGLRAEVVLGQLINEFGVEEPELTQNPVGFFARQLRSALFVATDTDAGTDPYALKSTIERLERASQRPAEPDHAGTETVLEQVRASLRLARYADALRDAKTLSIEDLSDEQVKELAETAWLSAGSLLDNSDDELEGYDLTEKLFDTLAARGSAFVSDVAPLAAMALRNKGITLSDRGRPTEALETYEAIIQRFGEDPNPTLREETAKSLVNKGVVLGELGRPDEAIAAYDEIVQRFGDDPSPVLREQTALALVNKGVALSTRGARDEEIAVYEEVLERFGDETSSGIREQLAKALLNKGVALSELGRSDDEIAAYDELLRRFGDDPNPRIREPTANALLNKGYTLGETGHNDQALAIADEVITRYRDDPALTRQIADAMENKGIALKGLGRDEDAADVFRDLVLHFGEDTNPDVAAIVARVKARLEEK